MNQQQAQRQSLPNGSLAMAGALVGFALLATITVRVFDIAPSASPVAVRAAERTTPVASRDLRFVDRADGAVVITDVKTGQIAHIVQAGEQTGFIRGVMRGLARDRKMRGLGDAAPFTLTAWRDGQLSLVDTATGRTLELTAFGTTNRAAFAELLK